MLKRQFAVFAVMAALAVASGCGSGGNASSTSQPGPIGAKCAHKYIQSEGVISDQGDTLEIDSLALDGQGDPRFDALVCVLDQLGTSSATRSLIASTTPDMGRQSRTDGGYTYTWSVEPPASSFNNFPTLSMVVEVSK